MASASKDSRTKGKELELDADAGFQRSEWRVQRVAWGVMALVMVLAAIGFAGQGLFSERRAASADRRLEIEYEKFARHQAPTDMTLHVAPDADSMVRLRLGRELIEGIEIERIVPEPASVAVAAGHVEYAFARRPGDTVAIRVRYQPSAVGPLRIRAQLGDAPIVEATQFLYP